MPYLTSTADILSLGTTATADIHVQASWVDYNGSTSTPGRTNTAITSIATTTIVAAPLTSVQRNVKTLIIKNTHATVANTVTLNHYDGTLTMVLIKVTLNAGETLSYTKGAGFEVLGTTGIIRVPTDPLIRRKVQRGETGRISATQVEALAFATALEVGTYVFDYSLMWYSPATGTGVNFGVNFDGTATTLCYNMFFASGATAAAAASPTQASAGAHRVLTCFTARSGLTTTGMGPALSTDVATTYGLFDAMQQTWVKGIVVVTVAGNLELWYGVDISSGNALSAASNVRVLKTG